MIYDFGCNALPFSQKFLPALNGALAVLAITAGMAALASAVQRRIAFRSTDIFFGWGLVAAFMTLAATAFPLGLPWIAALLGVLGTGAAVFQLKQGYFRGTFWLLTLFPGLVILTAINLAGITGWDDFSHWVPNALYLFHFDSLPSASMPPTHSGWPGYPYAIPFVTYLSSSLAAGFLVQGGAMFNFLLLFAFAAMLVEAALGEEGARRISWNSIGLLGFALLFVTLLNPSFNASFTITSEGDTGLMVLAGAEALLLSNLIEALREKNKAAIHDLVLQIAFIAAALVLVKQVGFVVLLLLVGAFLTVSFKNKALKPAAFKLPLMLALAVLLRFVWQHYVDTQIAGKWFGIAPFSEWHFDMIPAILHAMLLEMTRKNGLFILIFLMAGFAVADLPRVPTRRSNFTLLAALTCVGYIGFLFLTYVGSIFSRNEILRAASFYRYTTHVGLLTMIFVWLYAPRIWANVNERVRIPAFIQSPFADRLPARKALALLSISLLPIVLAVHGYWIVRTPTDRTCGYRELGRKVAAALPDHQRTLVVDTESYGYGAAVVNFEAALVEAKGGISTGVYENITCDDDSPMTALQNRFPNEKTGYALIIHRPENPLYLGQGKDWKPITY